MSKPVCIIGATVVKELFGGEEALGKRIRIGKTPCSIIGTMTPKPDSASPRAGILHLIPCQLTIKQILFHILRSRIWLSIPM